MHDAIVLSDIHLGSSNCQAKELCHFLESLLDGGLRTHKLVLNGDVFDSIDFSRLKKRHWEVLSLLRKLSNRIEIIWISGNHDGSAEILSQLLGVTVTDEYVLESGTRRILVLHGHAFDDFLDEHPILTWLGDMAYLFLQWIDQSHHFAKMAKRGSKIFLRCAKKIEEGAVNHARRLNCHTVCCGHTHHAVSNNANGILYYNSGCWTEMPCTYLAVTDGHVQLLSRQTELLEAPFSESMRSKEDLLLEPRVVDIASRVA